MIKSLVSNDLWEALAPLLPRERPKPKGGRPRCDDRLVLAGIIFVLRSGIPWEMLPREVGCSGMSCGPQAARLAGSRRLDQAPSRAP
ncbi:transposase [Paracoccus sp. SSK6]|uniref:transposase n=1 Tax=Paracoccus sp. SSK6 TaxID=3143131 RepID=UPI003219061C